MGKHTPMLRWVFLLTREAFFIDIDIHT